LQENIKGKTKLILNQKDITSMSFYLIRNKQVSWGDYGNIIVYGFISKEGTDIIVERTVPFVPSVYSYNKYIAIVDSLKEGIESLNLKGVRFNKTKRKNY
jgi:hypothetical protein